MGRLLIVAVIALACAVMSLHASGDEVRAFGETFQRNHLLSGDGDTDAWKIGVSSRMLWGGKQEVFQAWSKAQNNNELYLTIYGAAAEALATHLADFDNKYNRAAEFITCISPPVKSKPEVKPPVPATTATSPMPIVDPATSPMPSATSPVAVVTPMPTTATIPAPSAAATPVSTPPVAPPIPEEDLERCHLKLTRLRVQLENTLPELVKGVGGDDKTPPKYFEAKPFTHEFKSFVLTFQGPVANELYHIYLAKEIAGGYVHHTDPPVTGAPPVIADLYHRTGSLGGFLLTCERLRLLNSNGGTPVTYTCRLLQETFKLRRSLN